ncbi:hypothetical protein V8G54_030807 [Vigna mungo]|uniref:Uncharacterized protein n=1 Tax=Vigna mungo TaxID=3915 RepID=A0AAQ3MX57_VIGMU
MPGVGVTKTEDCVLIEALGVSASGPRPKSSRSHPPSSSFSSATSPSSKIAATSPFCKPSASTMSSSSPQSASAASYSSSSATPRLVLSKTPSNMPRMTLRRGQSLPHITGDGGIKREGTFPAGNDGTLSPSSAASRSATSCSPWTEAVI